MQPFPGFLFAADQRQAKGIIEPASIHSDGDDVTTIEQRVERDGGVATTLPIVAASPSVAA